MHEGLVVSEQGELLPLQEESEMMNRIVGCQKLPVEGGLVGLSSRVIRLGSILGEEGEWRPGAT